jgi:hypothetical protein
MPPSGGSVQARSSANSNDQFGAVYRVGARWHQALWTSSSRRDRVRAIVVVVVVVFFHPKDSHDIVKDVGGRLEKVFRSETNPGATSLVFLLLVHGSNSPAPGQSGGGVGKRRADEHTNWSA